MSLFNLSLKPVESRVRLDRSVERGGTPLTRIVKGERVLLSRGLCHFECAPLPPGGRNLRAKKAAELSARTRTPFADPEFKLLWSATGVGVWSWSRSEVQNLDGDDITVWPETLIHKPAEGAVLRPCIDGFEGQNWAAGNMIASRWWARKPTTEQWERFVRSASQQDGATAPGSESRTLAAPEASFDPIAATIRFAQALRARDIAALAVALVLAPVLFLAGRLAHLEYSIQSRQAELTSVQTASAEVLSARRASMSAATTLTAYQDLSRQTHPAAPLNVFAQTAAGFGAELQTFSFNGRQLEIILSGRADLPVAEMVMGLENDSLLSNVQLERTNRSNEWRIFADVEEAAG